MVSNRTVQFFDSQFQRQVGAGEFVLNPFEEAALPHLQGRVLDLGCGLGNLSLAAARRGCEVVAVDGSRTAVERLSRVAQEERLRLTPVQADVQDYQPGETFDTVVAIGLLMFFPCPVARALLERVQHAVRPGGCAVVTILVQGTTFMEMFDGERYCLLTPEQLEAAFAGWTILLSRQGDFPAPGGTVKRFSSLIARRP